MYTRGVYRGVDLIPYILFIPVFVVLLLFLFCAARYAWRVRRMEGYEPENSNQGCMRQCCSYWAWAEWMYIVTRKTGEAWLEYVLKHNFKRVDDHVILKGYALPKWYVYWISLTPVVVFFFVLTTFWEICFIAESYDCVPESNDVDCFLRNSSWSEQPLNCSEIKAISDDDFVCYRFVFEVTLAAGAAGGILTVSALVNGWAITIATNVSAHLGRFGRVVLVLLIVIVLQSLLPTAILLLAIYTDIALIRQFIAVFIVILTTITIFPWFKTTKRVQQHDGNLCPPCFRGSSCCSGSHEESTSKEPPNEEPPNEEPPYDPTQRLLHRNPVNT